MAQGKANAGKVGLDSAAAAAAGRAASARERGATARRHWRRARLAHCGSSRRLSLEEGPLRAFTSGIIIHMSLSLSLSLHIYIYIYIHVIYIYIYIYIYIFSFEGLHQPRHRDRGDDADADDGSRGQQLRPDVGPAVAVDLAPRGLADVFLFLFLLLYSSFIFIAVCFKHLSLYSLVFCCGLADLAQRLLVLPVELLALLAQELLNI